MKDKPKTGAVIGMDFGATNLKAIVVDEAGQVHERCVTPSRVHEGPGRTLERIAELVTTMEGKARQAGLSVTDVGIGVCAPVDLQTGSIPESPVLPGWKNVPVKEVIQTASGLPVHLDNDANMAVLGEWWQGVARKGRVVAGLTLGTGIGGGLVIDGRVFRGAKGLAAEFGHISVASSPPCSCGGTGCLGRLASITDTLERYRQLAGDEAVIVDNIDELGKLAKSGDRFAKESIRVSSDYIARVTLVLVNSLNPDVFVLAGGMSLLGSMLLDPIRHFIDTSTFPLLSASTRIVTAELGIYSGCFGSARLALLESGTPGDLQSACV